MPIYEYRCEILRFPEGSPAELSDPVLTTCPECGKDSYAKQLSAAGFPVEGQRLVRHRLRGGTSKPEPNPPKSPALPGRHRRLRVRGQLIRRYFVTGLLIWVPWRSPPGCCRSSSAPGQDAARPARGHPSRADAGRRPARRRRHPDPAHHLPHRVLAANFIGQRLVVWWELLLARIPVVNSIYNSVKRVSDTLFSSSGNAFRKALLVQYPREGSWTIAFLTGQPGGDVVTHLKANTSAFYCRPPRTRPPASS